MYSARWFRPACLSLAVALVFLACEKSPEGGDLVSTPIIHIGQNEQDPRLMETAILLVIRSPFETVKRYVSDPTNIKSYMAFAEESHAQPFPGGPESDHLVKVKMTVVDVFGVSVSGKPLDLRWHPVQSNESVFAISFEMVEGSYEHFSGTIYAANLSDGSTAVMLRTTTRSGFVPEGVRERLSRWHAQASIRKLAELLESQASG